MEFLADSVVPSIADLAAFALEVGCAGGLLANVGNLDAFHPPPSVLIRSTLAFMRLRRMSTETASRLLPCKGRVHIEEL